MHSMDFRLKIGDEGSSFLRNFDFKEIFNSIKNSSYRNSHPTDLYEDTGHYVYSNKDLTRKLSNAIRWAEKRGGSNYKRLRLPLRAMLGMTSDNFSQEKSNIIAHDLGGAIDVKRLPFNNEADRIKLYVRTLAALHHVMGGDFDEARVALLKVDPYAPGYDKIKNADAWWQNYRSQRRRLLRVVLGKPRSEKQGIDSRIARLDRIHTKLNSLSDKLRTGPSLIDSDEPGIHVAGEAKDGNGYYAPVDDGHRYSLMADFIDAIDEKIAGKLSSYQAQTHNRLLENLLVQSVEHLGGALKRDIPLPVESQNTIDSIYANLKSMTVGAQLNFYLALGNYAKSDKHFDDIKDKIVHIGGDLELLTNLMTEKLSEYGIVTNGDFYKIVNQLITEANRLNPKPGDEQKEGSSPKRLELHPGIILSDSYQQDSIN